MVDQRDIRLRQFAILTDATWRHWPDSSRQWQHDSIEGQLHNRHRVTAKPTMFIDWPHGWFIKLADGSAYWLSVHFIGLVAYFPHDPIIQLQDATA